MTVIELLGVAPINLIRRVHCHGYGVGRVTLTVHGLHIRRQVERNLQINVTGRIAQIDRQGVDKPGDFPQLFWVTLQSDTSRSDIYIT